VPEVTVDVEYQDLAYRTLTANLNVHHQPGIAIKEVLFSVNGDEMPAEVKDNVFKLEGLNDGVNFFEVIVTYEKDGETLTVRQAQKVFDLSLSSANRAATEPHNFHFDIINHAEEKGIFHIDITFDDPDDVLRQIIVTDLDTEKRLSVVKGEDGVYRVTYDGAIDDTHYRLKFEMDYHLYKARPLAEITTLYQENFVDEENEGISGLAKALIIGVGSVIGIGIIVGGSFYLRKSLKA